MRSEFQDVFKDAYDHWIDDACSHRYNASKSLALQVWQHQQSKVDELQKRVDDLTELNRLKTIALQQSVNRTSPYVHEKIVALEQALKGGGE